MTEEQQEIYADLQASMPVHIAALHLDAEGQADLAYRAGELAAELKAAARRSKMQLEEVQAAADLVIRRDPVGYGVEKVTETAVRNAVTMHASVKAAAEALLAADRDSGLADALANGFEHRRSMLKLEVDLYTSNYYGDPQAGGRDIRQTAAQAGAAQTGRRETAVEEARADRRRRARET